MWNLQLFGNSLYYLFYLFVLYSFVGWIYESTLVSVRKRTFVNRGFLKGPVIPIYGFGALSFYLVLWQYKEDLFILFIGGLILATVLEYFTSLIMELIFHTRWWDYSDHPFNIQGRVSLFVSVFWGLLAIVMIRYIQPGINNIIVSIPRETGEIAGVIIFVIIMIDTVTSIISTVHFEKVLIKLQELREDMAEYVATTKIYGTGEEIRAKFSNQRIIGLFSDVRAKFEDKIPSPKNRLPVSRPDSGKIKPEYDSRMKEFINRYQNIKINKSYARILRAFPTMKVGKREAALSDLRDKLVKLRVSEVGKDLKDEVKGTVKANLSGIFRVVLVGVLVLAQFALIIYLSLVLQGFTIYLYSFIQILSIIIIIGLLSDNRNTSYKVSWICIIAAFPITGHIMFMLWGNRRKTKMDRQILQKLQHGATYLEKDPVVLKSFSEKYPDKNRMAKYLEYNTFPLYKNNKVQYYPMSTLR